MPNKIKERRDDCTERVGQHAFLGVPRVALAAEDGDAGGGVGANGVTPFKHFVSQRDSAGGEHSKQAGQPTWPAEMPAFEELSDGERVKADGEMRAEYDLSGAVRGNYYKRYLQCTNVVVLEPDVARRS